MGMTTIPRRQSADLCLLLFSNPNHPEFWNAGTWMPSFSRDGAVIPFTWFPRMNIVYSWHRFPSFVYDSYKLNDTKYSSYPQGLLHRYQHCTKFHRMPSFLHNKTKLLYLKFYYTYHLCIVLIFDSLYCNIKLRRSGSEIARSWIIYQPSVKI